MKSKRTTFIATVLAAALVGSGFAVGLETQRSATQAEARGNDSPAVSRSQNGNLPSFSDLAARVSPAVVASTPVGKTVPVDVMRDGKTKTLSVAISRLNDQTAAVNTKEEKSQWGLALRDIRPDERNSMGLTGKDGVLVTAVMPGSPAQNSGIQPGDVILQVNHVQVSSVQGVKDEIAKAKENKPLLVLLRRADGSTLFAALSRNVG